MHKRINSGLQETFDRVRQTFFPKWRRGDEWTVREDPTLTHYGRCDDDTKTIVIQPGWANDSRLYLILIHEICHAITREPHTKKWRKRFNQAGDTAKEMGQEELARMIYDEAKRYADHEKPLRLNERLIYATIEDVLLKDPDITYEESIEWVARLWGVTIEDVVGFRDCEKVYEETIRKISQVRSRLGL